MWRATVFLCLFPGLAAADGLVDDLRGLYGSATDPAGSCSQNPHQLDFLARPPHMTLTWKSPWVDASGQTVYDRRYDLLSIDATTLTLRWEDDPDRTDSGDRPTRILRHTTLPEGYCWGRADWPQMRCEDQQLRCDAPVS